MTSRKKTNWDTRINVLHAHFSEVLQKIAHDVQSPAKKILSFSDLLAMKLPVDLAGSTQDYVQRIQNNAALLSKIIQQLRDYAIAGAMPNKFTAVDMNDALNEAKINLKEKFEAVRPSLAISKLPKIRGAHLQLVRLWQILLSNALIYRREEPAVLQVAAIRGKTGEWVFSVRDNGRGIADTRPERLFQIFSASTAVGLALARRIVENHGGQIWCKSRPGTGSTFYFSLPPNASRR